MTPTRRDLLRQVAELICITQDLVRATEESTRASRQLQQDVARLVRRSGALRSRKLDRRARDVAAAGRADFFPPLRMTVMRGGAGAPSSSGGPIESSQGASVAVGPAPPAT